MRESREKLKDRPCEDAVRFILYSIVKGVADLHSEKIVHNELNPNTVIIDQ
jgi:serine/threonine protein kinase